jgi:hypothetical protein
MEPGRALRRGLRVAGKAVSRKLGPLDASGQRGIGALLDPHAQDVRNVVQDKNVGLVCELLTARIFSD